MRRAPTTRGYCQATVPDCWDVAARRPQSAGRRLSIRGLAAVLMACSLLGCSRSYYRQQADQEAYQLVRSAASDPRWPLPGYTIQPDPRSRFADPHPPDRPPMPPDDPVSHRLMHCVDGKRGFCWHRWGDTPWVENPTWEQFLPWDETSQSVPLDLENTVALGLMHSRNYQEQLEELYLSALDVAFERFRFDAQFFGGNDTFLTADGRARAGNTRSRSVFNTDTNVVARQLYANGGELVVGFANSLIWQFSGSNTYTANSLLNFTLVEPLLRAGGRALVLERLTIAERTLLGNVRAMERYRRNFYVSLVSGRDLSGGPSRRGGFFGGAGLTGFTGVGGGGFGRVGGLGGGAGGGGGIGAGTGAQQAGGYWGLLQAQQELRNLASNVADLAGSLQLLQAYQQANRIDQLQVDLAKQQFYAQQSRFLNARTAFQNQLDAFKVTLGLPPDVPVTVRDSQGFLDRFQLMSPQLLRLQQQGNSVLVQLWAPQASLQAPKQVLLANTQSAQRLRFWLDQAAELVRTPDGLRPPRFEQYDALLLQLADAQDRLRDQLDPLLAFPQALESAAALHRAAQEQFADVSAAVDRLQREAPQRRRTLEEIARGQRSLAEEEQYGYTVEDPVRRFDERLESLLQRRDAVQSRVLEQLPQWRLATWDERRRSVLPLRQQAFTLVDRLDAALRPLEIQMVLLQSVQAAPLAEPARSALQTALLRQLDASLAGQLDMLGQLHRDVHEFVQSARTALETASRPVKQLVQDVSDMGLLRARAQLELIELTPIELTEQRARELAWRHRRDLMNARAQLVDAWRLIEFNATDLESQLDIVFSGDISNTGDNPLRFRDTTGRLRVGFQFDAPLTRLAERNLYRQSLIEYQQARRNFMNFEDRILLGLRNTLHAIELNRSNFEQRREAVHIALAQVEQARFRLLEPPRPRDLAPGAAAAQTGFGPTASRDLVDSFDAFLQAQNAFMSVWINHEVQRLNLDFDLGTMRLDERGMWIDPGSRLGWLPPYDSHLEEPELLPVPGHDGTPQAAPAPEPERLPGVGPAPPPPLLRPEVASATRGDSPLLQRPPEPPTVFVRRDRPTGRQHGGLQSSDDPAATDNGLSP